jgi:hypothetical protein
MQIRVTAVMMLLSAFACATVAQTSSKLQPFTSLCTENEITGYALDRGRVNRVDEKSNSQWVVTKINSASLKDPNSKLMKGDDYSFRECAERVSRWSEKGSLTWGCYTITDPKWAKSKKIGQVCEEHWKEDGSLNMITCNEFAIIPSGPFVRASVWRGWQSQRDFAQLSNGTCAQIQ